MGAITVGTTPTLEGGVGFGGRSMVTSAKLANADGTLTTFKLEAAAGEGFGFSAGTVYSTGVNKFTGRDYENLLAWPGSLQTYGGLDCDVESGDYFAVQNGTQAQIGYNVTGSTTQGYYGPSGASVFAGEVTFAVDGGNFDIIAYGEGATLPAPPDAPSDPYPEDDATLPAIVSTEISCLVTHPDSLPMDVTFKTAAGATIGVDEDVASGSRASTTWAGLEPDSTYQFGAIAKDENDNETESPLWEFYVDTIPDIPIDLVPLDGRTTKATTSIPLSCYVSNGSEFTMEVEFRTSAGALIVTAEDVPPDSRAKVNWTGRTLGQAYNFKCRARAYDEEHEEWSLWSEYSEVVEFTVGTWVPPYIAGSCRRLPDFYLLSVIGVDYTGPTACKEFLDELVTPLACDAMEYGEILLFPHDCIQNETWNDAYTLAIQPISDSRKYFCGFVGGSMTNKPVLNMDNAQESWIAAVHIPDGFWSCCYDLFLTSTTKYMFAQALLNNSHRAQVAGVIFGEVASTSVLGNVAVAVTSLGGPICNSAIVGPLTADLTVGMLYTGAEIESMGIVYNVTVSAEAPFSFAANYGGELGHLLVINGVAKNYQVGAFYTNGGDIDQVTCATELDVELKADGYSLTAKDGLGTVFDKKIHFKNRLGVAADIAFEDYSSTQIGTMLNVAPDESRTLTWDETRPSGSAVAGVNEYKWTAYTVGNLGVPEEEIKTVEGLSIIYCVDDINGVAYDEPQDRGCRKFSNTLPTVDSLSPTDGATIPATDTASLSAKYHDDDGNIGSLLFYEPGGEGTLIDTATGLDDGEVGTISWPDRTPGESCSFQVLPFDGEEYGEFSEIVTFTIALPSSGEMTGKSGRVAPWLSGRVGKHLSSRVGTRVSTRVKK